MKLLSETEYQKLMSLQSVINVLTDGISDMKKHYCVCRPNSSEPCARAVVDAGDLIGVLLKARGVLL